ncbi:MAG: DUF2793 domain-containing protein [Sphaerospermopsis kisseleviana]
MPTPRSGLPQLSEGQASKATTINEALAKLEALTIGGVISRTTTTPPASPAEGDIYIVPASATGAWSGQNTKIAHYFNGAWQFYSPANGWYLFSIPDAKFVWFNGTAWGLV